ncbi:MAG: hypothetical protein ACK42G_04930 [Candidatus Kapaibacteriota bacterium]
MFDELIDELNELAVEFAKKYFNKNFAKLSATEKLRVVMQADFYKDLFADKRIAGKFENIKKRFESELLNIVSLGEKFGVKKISKLTVDNLALLYEIDATWILGSAQSYADMLRSTLIKSVVAGLDNREILKQIETIPLMDYQKRVAINQSFINYRNLILEKTFGNTDIRFRFVGPNDEKTREVCRKALENQKEEGYTMDEIKAGELEGIDWYNLGGFNCRHYFEPIIE